MKLEQQVVSLELAQKLKELGVKQDSLFWWVGGRVKPSNRIDYHLENDKEYAKNWIDYLSAYTVAELGKMLPYRVLGGKKPREFYLRIYKTDKLWQVGYFDLDTYLLTDIFNKSLIDSMAEMLIYLKENNLIN